jgi:tryptophanyl-tRNA synthetase
MYTGDEEGGVFPEPKELLTEAPKVPGTDGRKMSKSYENAIYLKDNSETVWEKLRPMVTDPARIRRTDPGDPKKCPVFELHGFFTSDESKDEVAEGCRTAGIGCIDCKKVLFEALEKVLVPLRDRRAELEMQPDLVKQILSDGNDRARREAERTMSDVRDSVKLYTG